MTPTDHDNTPAGALLGEIGLGPDQSASANNPINGGMLQQAVSTIVVNNIPRVDEIAKGIQTTYATTSTPVAVNGNVSQSGSRVPTAKEENDVFVSNEQMADMRISFISSLNINNVASIVGNGVTAILGNVTNLGTSVVNAIQNANNTPALVDGSGVIIGLTSAAATLGSGVFNLIGAVGNGLVRTINGEIKYPILSDEPDRVVLCATASILTTCNQTIHDLLQACDSAIAKLTNNGKTVGHTLICITGAVADSLANAIWDTAATGMNLAEIPHPHGLVAYV
ncbi:hypothetical protein JCM31185_08550 [Furfurilactobacillus curtus]|uniref:Uncharacterized protein n=1 Tax=Furfurilactobacillus curtus TaxID=1746200 RepID=A0ABQ5JMC5_9LACO